MIKYKARLILQMLNIAGGLLLVNLSYIMAYYLRFLGTPPVENFRPYLLVAPFLTAGALFFLSVYGMHTNAKKSLSEIIPSVICIVFLISVTTIALSYFFGKFAFPRTVFLLSAAIQLILLSLWFSITRRFERTAHGTRRVILIGEHKTSEAVAERIERESQGLYRVNGIIAPEKSSEETSLVIGTYKDYKALLNVKNADLFIISSDLDSNLKKEIICFCIENNLTVFVIPEVYELLLANSRMTQIGDTLLVGMGGLQIDPNYKLIKRLMDLVISSMALILLFVPMGLIAVAIKVSSKGPIFYKQQRVSENGEIFEIYKFRTMIQDAEKSTGPVLAKGDDPRITRVGKWLRATRIDEIPQLINVLKGEMSLVGPRPERPYFVDQFSKRIPNYHYRKQVKAGVTGLAQVEGKYTTSAEDKLRYDLLYANTYSPLKDVKILLQTLKVILIKDKSV